MQRGVGAGAAAAGERQLDLLLRLDLGPRAARRRVPGLCTSSVTSAARSASGAVRACGTAASALLGMPGELGVRRVLHDGLAAVARDGQQPRASRRRGCRSARPPPRGRGGCGRRERNSGSAAGRWPFSVGPSPATTSSVRTQQVAVGRRDVHRARTPAASPSTAARTGSYDVRATGCRPEALRRSVRGSGARRARMAGGPAGRPPPVGSARRRLPDQPTTTRS